LTLTTATDAQAQESPEPQRYENVDWNNVVMVDFKPGKRGRALEIIREHYVPASEEAGTPMPVMIEMMSGEYDLMFVWMMDDGPSEMTWERSPESIAWRSALVDMMGSEEETEKLQDEYSSLINRSISYIGFSGRHGMRIAGN
jgi:hypothetical protein